MNGIALSKRQHDEVHAQVAAHLEKNTSYRRMSPRDRRQILADTAKIVEAMAAGPRATPDPYAVGLEKTEIVGNASKLIKDSGGKVGDVINAGVTAAANMVNEIDFPQFVSELIKGTFHAIVTSSIEQMQAYAEMVKSVSMSLNEFKDKNTTDNQARDHLVSRYPRHLKITIVDGAPRCVPREDADDQAMPDFGRELGLDESITSLDEDVIEERLIPAARDDLARGRQQLLATTILMGINRIIVTDGKINAKIKFQFSANEKRKMSAAAFDYANMGTSTSWEGSSESDSDYNYSRSKEGEYSGDGSSYAKGEWKYKNEPMVKVTSEVNTSTDSAIQASGQIMGEVSVNFRSETFPLEKMVNTDQMMRLQDAQSGAGRGAPPPARPALAAAPAAAPSSAPAATVTT